MYPKIYLLEFQLRSILIGMIRIYVFKKSIVNTTPHPFFLTAEMPRIWNYPLWLGRGIPFLRETTKPQKEQKNNPGFD
jgi:hypothetical protein